MVTVNIEKIKSLDYRSKEAYKTLRTNLQFCGNDIKVVAITSCVQNEGKSLVSFNLAISLAESGKKVLFIDSDLRKSVLVGRYKIQESLQGLTQYLAGKEGINKVINKTNIENLDLIVSGPVPPNPAELLGSQEYSDLIKAVRDEYDYVIVDTPPIGQVIDAAIVAQKSDGVIMLVSQGNISYKFAQKQIAQLKKSGCKILGAVLNKVNDENKGKYYGKYYGYYKY